MSTSVHHDYEYVNEGDIDDELICMICKEPLESPVSLCICNHTFCKRCIEVWLHYHRTCPLCRRLINDSYLENPDHSSSEQTFFVPIKTRVVLNQLDGLLVRCLQCQQTNIQRCSWQVHKNFCSKKVVSCPSADIKCPWKGSRDTLLIHLKNCVYQQVRPIIEELRNELKLTQCKQIELKKSMDILERRVDVLLKFINNEDMARNSTKRTNECIYSRTDGR